MKASDIKKLRGSPWESSWKKEDLINILSETGPFESIYHFSSFNMAWFVENHFPSEPIFVPKPHSTLEDDGVVLATVFDGEEGATYLAIIDATSMKTVATIYCEDDWKHLMSFGIHGDFFSCKA